MFIKRKNYDSEKGSPSWKKTFTVHVSNKRIISKIYKVYAHIIKKKRQMGGQRLGYFSREEIQMASKYIKKILGLVSHQRNKNKSTMSDNYSPTKLAKMKRTENKKCWGHLGGVVD